MKIKIQASTPINVRNLIFSLLDIFKHIGIPVENTDRRLERMAKACLAVGQIKTNFQEAMSFEDGCFMRTRGIIAYENEFLGESISMGSYDDIRRQDLKLLVEAGVVVNSSSTEEQATKQPVTRLWLEQIVCCVVAFFWNITVERRIVRLLERN